MPQDRVLTETDAPFAQIAGTPLMPWDVVDAEAMLAGLWGVTSEEVRVRLRQNLLHLARSASEMPVERRSPDCTYESRLRAG